MHERRRLILLILIMMVVAGIIGASAIYIIYQGGLDRERVRLQDIVQSQARLLESLAKFDETYSRYPEGPEAGSLKQFIDVQRTFTPRGLGRTGEVTLARRAGDTIVYLIGDRHKPVDAPETIPFDGVLAAPMRAALNGESGTMIGRDFAGTLVLAAYEPVAVLNVGLVAKIDIAEIRENFTQAALPLIVIATVAVFAAAALFSRITEPVLRRIRGSEARFRGTFENAAVGIAHVGFDGAWLRVNARLCEIVGYGRDELLERTFQDITHPDDLQADLDLFGALMRGETGSYGIEKRYSHKDGHIVWVNLTTALQRDEDGQPLYCISVVEDISRRKNVESELRRLYQAIQQSPSSVVITDRAGSIVYVNPKFCDVTGYTHDEVVGQNPRVLKSGYTDDGEYKQLWNTITSGQTWRGEFRNRRKDGQYYWEIASIAPVKDDAGRIINFVGVKEDVTERRAIEEQLRQSQKMQAIGQLTGGIAHDFNNLLTIIVGNLQLLDRALAADDASRNLITDALWAAQRGGELTHRLLAFARMQPLNPARVNLNDIVRGLTGLLQRTLGAGIDVIEALDADIPDVLADTGELERALVNLAINARDAMPAGGRLTVETARATLDADYVERCPDVAPGDYAMLAVGDTGTGIEPSLLGRIFEPFFTTKKVGQGSGLGLSMVYGFIKQSGGHISVYSEPGVGTTIKLFFPIASAATGTDREAADGGEGKLVAMHDRTALVVEDEERLRKVAVRLLDEVGFTVLEAGDGDEALRHAESAQRIDLLFTDVELPGGMNGMAIARHVQQRHAEVRVLYTTGYSTALAATNGRVPHEAPLLAKPYARQQLMRHLRTLFPDASADADAGSPTPPRPRPRGTGAG